MLSFLTATEFSKKKRRPSDTVFAYKTRLNKDIRRRLKHQGWISLSTVTKMLGTQYISEMIREVVNLKWYDCYLDIMVLTYLSGKVITFVKRDQIITLEDIIKEGDTPDIAWLFEESTRQQFLKGMELNVSNSKKINITDQGEDILKEITAAGLF